MLIFFSRVLGAAVIVIGLYMVVWGKSKDYGTERLSNDGEDSTMKSYENAVPEIEGQVLV